MKKSMRVFVTGATGFIGSAVVRELVAAGHEVTGLARSEASAASLRAMGAKAHMGSLEDLESLRRGAAAAEGAVHTAFFHQFGHARLATRLRVIFGGAPGGIVTRFMGAAVETDRRAIATIGGALRGEDRALVVACATMAMRPGRVATEEDAPDPNAVGAMRTSEAATLAFNASGVRASAIRLPPSVHGDGDRAFIAQLIDIARKTGVSAMVGDGENRWPAVHRLDAARLFRSALESGTSPGKYHAVGDEGIPFRTIAETIGRRIDVPVVSLPPERAAKHFGWLATFVGVDNPASSELTRERFGWNPTEPGLLADLESSWYFDERLKRA